MYWTSAWSAYGAVWEIWGRCMPNKAGGSNDRVLESYLGLVARGSITLARNWAGKMGHLFAFETVINT